MTNLNHLAAWVWRNINGLESERLYSSIVWVKWGFLNLSAIYMWGQIILCGREAAGCLSSLPGLHPLGARSNAPRPQAVAIIKCPISIGPPGILNFGCTVDSIKNADAHSPSQSGCSRSWGRLRNPQVLSQSSPGVAEVRPRPPNTVLTSLFLNFLTGEMGAMLSVL